MAVNISTMYGFPTETREMAQRTLDWLGELPKPSLLPYHFCLRFFPGCEINQQAMEAGWDAERLGLTSRFSYNDMPMGTPTLSKHEMNEIQIEYHRRFGMSNPAAVDGAVRTLRSIGYERHGDRSHVLGAEAQSDSQGGRADAGGWTLKRWYRHRFHNVIALSIVFSTMRWLPRFVQPPIAAVTALIFFLLLKRERRAVARNLRQSLGQARAWRCNGRSIASSIPSAT